MRLFRKRVRIEDPDDNRKHYSGGKRVLITVAVSFLILIGVLIYIFLPVWLYVIFVPILTIAFVWRPAELDEEDRIRRYLSRIPPGERFPRKRFYQRIGIPSAQLDTVSARFPDWCGEGRDILEAEEMYRLVLCWYYGTVKQLSDAMVVRLLEQAAVKPS